MKNVTDNLTTSNFTNIYRMRTKPPTYNYVSLNLLTECDNYIDDKTKKYNLTPNLDAFTFFLRFIKQATQDVLLFLLTATLPNAFLNL